MKKQQINSPNHLITLVRRYAKHRVRMMTAYGAYCTRDRLMIAAEIINKMNYVTGSDKRKKAGMVLQVIPDLQLLSAGKKSKYYQTEQDKIKAFKEYAEAILDGKEAQAPAISQKGSTRKKGNKGASPFSSLKNTPL